MTKTLFSAAILSLSFLGASAVQAQELGYPPEVAQTSQVSAEQVRAEAVAARQAGEIFDGEQDQTAHFAPASLTRAQVQAELRQARAAGDVQPGEQDPSLVSQG